MRSAIAAVCVLACGASAQAQFDYVSQDRRVLVEIDRGYRTLQSIDIIWVMDREERSAVGAEMNESVTVSTRAGELPGFDAVGVDMTATAWQNSILTESMIHAAGGFRDVRFTEYGLARAFVESSLDVVFDVTRPTMIQMESNIRHGVGGSDRGHYFDPGRTGFSLTNQQGARIGGDHSHDRQGTTVILSLDDDVILSPGRYTLSIMADNDLIVGTATDWPDASFDVTLTATQVIPKPATWLAAMIVLILLLRRANFSSLS